MTGEAVAVGVAPLFSCFVDFLQIVVGIRKFASFKIEFFQRVPAAFLMREKIPVAERFSPLSISSVYPFFDKKNNRFIICGKMLEFVILSPLR